MGFGWWLALVIAPSGLEPVGWNAPPECPDAAAVQAMVETHLGSSWVPGTIEVEADVEASGAGRFRLTLVVAHAGIRDERELVAHECEALARAAALVIALGVDAVAVARVERDALPDASTPAGTEPVPRTLDVDPREEAPSAAPTPTPTPRAAARRPHAVLAVVGGIERGAVPGVTGGSEIAIGVRTRVVRVELAGVWLGPRVADIGIASVQTQLGAVALRGCPELQLRRLSIPLCMGVEVGAMRGAGREAPGARTVNRLWIAPALSPGVRVPFGRVAVVARGEISVAVQRPSFELREPGEPVAVFTPEMVSTRLWLGIEVRVGRADATKQ